MPKYLRSFVLGLLFLTIFSGCGVSSNNNLINTTPTMSTEVTLTFASHGMPTSTKTILPTLEPTQAILLVEDLLVNNAGCKLPCWWGIIPGTTEWNEAKQFLQTFAIDFQELTGESEIEYQTVFLSIEKPTRLITKNHPLEQTDEKNSH